MAAVGGGRSATIKGGGKTACNRREMRKVSFLPRRQVVMLIDVLLSSRLTLYRIAEGLGNEDLASMRSQPVIGQPAGHRGQEHRGEVREGPGLGEDQEPGIVGNELEALELLGLSPAAPAVTRLALEGAVLPGGQAEPLAAEGGDVSEAAPGQPAKAEIVVLVHQRVPEGALIRSCQAALDLGQAEAFRLRPVDRVGVHAGANRHGGYIAHAGREPSQTCRSSRGSARLRWRDARCQDKSSEISVGWPWYCG